MEFCYQRLMETFNLYGEKHCSDGLVRDDLTTGYHGVFASESKRGSKICFLEQRLWIQPHLDKQIDWWRDYFNRTNAPLSHPFAMLKNKYDGAENNREGLILEAIAMLAAHHDIQVICYDLDERPDSIILQTIHHTAVGLGRKTGLPNDVYQENLIKALESFDAAEFSAGYMTDPTVVAQVLNRIGPEIRAGHFVRELAEATCARFLLDTNSADFIIATSDGTANPLSFVIGGSAHFDPNNPEGITTCLMRKGRQVLVHTIDQDDGTITQVYCSLPRPGSVPRSAEKPKSETLG